MTRTELINYIIKRQGYKNYLEIGVSNGHSLKGVNCFYKIGVDPDINSKADYKVESDYFFSTTIKKAKIPAKYDCIFIDGLHHFDQVRRDIINAWACLNDGGCLVIHDTNPDREEITKVPRETKEWCGDVYRAVYQVLNKKFTLQDDHGVTVIRKTGELIMTEGEITWEEFTEFRGEVLSLVTAEEAIKIIDTWK